QFLDVVFGAQRLAVVLVAMGYDAKAGVIDKAHRAELAVQKCRLFGRGVDA
ncbi:hypothetical protein SAMN05421693_1161, partial [Ectothiorhodospira magna]